MKQIDALADARSRNHIQYLHLGINSASFKNSSEITANNMIQVINKDVDLAKFAPVLLTVKGHSLVVLALW